MKDPVVEAYKKDIDRTPIRENLKLSVKSGFESNGFGAVRRRDAPGRS